MKKTLIYVMVFGVASCNTLGGHKGISDTVEESKEIGTYLKEFRIVSGNSEELKGVKNIWAEYAWNYPYTFKKTKIRKESQTLLFEFDNLEKLKNYEKTWALREDVLEYENYNFTFKSPYKSIFCENFNCLKDTVRLNLVRGDLLNNKIVEKREIILVAKK